MSEPIDIKDIEGVGPATASKLNEAGFYSIESLAVAPTRELMDKVGLTYETALKIAEAARRLVKIDFITAKELWNRRSSMIKISTGCDSLNELLGGGIETQAMTEFWGEYASGKSQLCMKLSVMAQIPKDKGGIEGNALFIDTEATFSPQRIYKMAEALDLDPDKTLENIIYARCYNSDHQLLIVDNSFRLCHEENIKLVVVDSLTSHWRADYIGRETLSDRQQKLNMHLHKLLRLAEIENLAVVVTNQVQANPATFFGDPNRPAGGNVVAHASTHRVLLRKSRGNTRVAKITDSPCLPSEPEAHFMITEDGIDEAPDKEKMK